MRAHLSLAHLFPWTALLATPGTCHISSPVQNNPGNHAHQQAILEDATAACTRSPAVSYTAGSAGGVSRGIDPFTDDFGEFARGMLEKWHVPGLSIGVVDGGVDFGSGYGFAELPNIAADPTTLWEVGSTSKAFTAAAAGLMINDSLASSSSSSSSASPLTSPLSWKTTLHSLIPSDFLLTSDHATRSITIEDALSHRTGMPRHDLSYGNSDHAHDLTIGKVVRSMRYLPLTADLRDKYQYCNIMFVAIAHVIERVTGIAFNTFVTDRILVPLGMHNTVFSIEAAKASKYHFAQGYAYSAAEDTYFAMPDFNMTHATGAGSIISNVIDYQKWIRSWIDRSGPLAASSHSSRPSLQQQLWHPRTIMDNVPQINRTNPFTGVEAYALGWITATYRGHVFYQHSGGMEAMGTNLIIFPDLKWGTIAFANTAATSNFVEEILQWRLIDDMLGVPEEERWDWAGQHEANDEKSDAAFANAPQRIFPNVPSPPLPLSVPVANYTGIYNHPAYGNMTVFEPTLADLKTSAAIAQKFDAGNSLTSSNTPTLKINRSNATWRIDILLTHVSTDYFLATTIIAGQPGVHYPFRERFPARFEVGADGVVKRLGMRMESAMGDEMIWFERI